MTWNTEVDGDVTLVSSDDAPGTRFAVVQDWGVSDPIVESGAPVEHYVVRAGYPSTTDTRDGPMSETFARFDDVFNDALEVTRRYARIFHGYTLAESEDRIALVMTRGYSQSDWAELFVHVSEDGYGTAESWAEEWAQYARGDVFGVTRQTRVPCDSCDCDEWEDGDTLWGIYADDTEEAAMYFSANY